MTGSRLVLLASAVLLALALVCFIGYANLPASRHYQLFGDAESLFRALTQLEADVTVNELVERLGTPVEVEEKLRQQLVNGSKDLAIEYPESYPDGVTDDDAFIIYYAGGVEVTLQVRDRKIVNFTPSDYRFDPQPVKMLNNLR